MVRNVLVLALAFLFSACGSSSNDSGDSNKTISLNDTDYVLVESGTLESSDSAIAGTGSFVQNTPLEGIESGNNFQLSATLEEGSSITLYANGSAKNANGLSIEFANNSGSLSVTASKSGTDVDISSSFAGKSATVLSYYLDIHNDESPAHVLIWNGIETGFDEEDALFNSEEDGEMPGNGAGTYFGVSMTDASLTKLTQAEPKFEEE